MSSADSSMSFIPAVDDGWAVLTEPPGARDLGLPEYWSHSSDRSRRRRAVRRSRFGEVQATRMGLAVAAVALTGSAAAAGGADDAAAAPATNTTSLNLARGSSGAAVAALQRRLGIAADGIFGPQTERAVRRFQRGHGLPAVGRVGPQTTAALGMSGSRAPSTAPAAGGPSVALSRAATRALQAKLGVTADGVMGPQTRAALKRWEASNGLAADGRPDARTLQALGVDASATGDDAEDPATDAAPSGSGATAAMRVALSLAGTPYRSGGTTPAGFDCSGLTMYAFKRAGISLPRTSYAQYGAGGAVRKSQVQAGDLVFFDTNGGGASHVGIATGPNTAVSATSHGVMQHSISDSYWGSHYVGARRVA